MAVVCSVLERMKQYMTCYCAFEQEGSDISSGFLHLRLPPIPRSRLRGEDGQESRVEGCIVVVVGEERDYYVGGGRDTHCRFRLSTWQVMIRGPSPWVQKQLENFGWRFAWDDR